MTETVSPGREKGIRVTRGGGGPGEGLGERILRRLIRSPKFKSSLSIILKGIDPENAPGLVRALMWGDVETFMGTASALPRLFNFAVRAVEELGAQMNSFPPEILLAFLQRLAGDVDYEGLERAAREIRLLLQRIEPVVGGLRERASKALAAEAPDAVGGEDGSG